ncbi:HPr kinase/phosphorylase [Roseomonas sp. USHLN139]|uniref:HPr kinase/phosphorylase n=1 Tax=Roseomonas sp. USHLN139 TaxID=3081298 RepID=UPI003B02AF8D
MLHGSAAALDGEGVLLLGAPGAGKSDLLLRLVQRGWRLVADDQVAVAPRDGGVEASAPAALAGLLEVRGLGIFEGLAHAPAPLRLVVELAPRADIPRLPLPRSLTVAGLALPCVALHGFDASAPDKLAWALAASRCRLRQRAGAFAA